MRFLSWKIWIGLGLIGLSVVLYGLNYLIFRDTNYMFRLFLAQLGFLPISVLLVTIIINQLLSQHAKSAKLAKLNMVIGAFFSEVGLDLLRVISRFDTGLESLREETAALGQWSGGDLIRFGQRLAARAFNIEVQESHLELLRRFLLLKRDFLLRLLENPNLLEHDSFSNLLLAVFHLTEELGHRDRLDHLAPADLGHLNGDLKRAYVLLTGEWLTYLAHLQQNYPYLFSLALRTNPFNPGATVEIT
jgi:hypothetical protein